MNCWEYFNCGKELGGHSTDIFGVCPAATESLIHGLHGGKNGGRSCWAIKGTTCFDKVSGDFNDKKDQCLKCEFHKKVLLEELDNGYRPPHEIEAIIQMQNLSSLSRAKVSG